VVTRYYGGTKLGRGGLVRAYSSGVKQALEGLPLIEKVRYCEIRLSVAYNYVSSLQRLAARLNVEILTETYAADVGFTLKIPEDGLAGFREELTQLTSGSAQFDENTETP